MSDNTESIDETEQDSTDCSSELYENAVPVEAVDEDVDFSWAEPIVVDEKT